MYLSELTIQRFRSCEDVVVKFRPDLTVLVGENNGGKSNVIEAIRLLSLPLSGRRERYAEEDDLRRGSAETSFTIEGRFSDLSAALKGLLVTAVPDPSVDKAILGMRHETKVAGSLRGRTSFFAGKFPESSPEPGSSELIRHVYLPPLRDAHKALGSGSASQIVSILKHFIGGRNEVEDAFLRHVQRGEEPHELINSVNSEIGSALGMLTKGVRPQTSSLDFHTEGLNDVARDLRFRLADAGVTPQDIRASGLGFSNLLYMATVIVELTNARDADLTVFLVEEPEAHLHPQLQMLVLEFLLEKAREASGREKEPGQPEGNIQVIVTTHSPNLTAWVSPEHLVVMRSKATQEEGHEPEPKTVSVPIAELGISPRTLNKVGRYLDVTRSALLFGDRALLVEGIAEALIVPALARHVVFNANRDAWQRFKGAVLASIEGVDFKPYVEVLLRQHEGTPISSRVVVITDADPSVAGNRKEDLERLAGEFGSRANLSVFVNQHTLEHELFVAGNENLLMHAFRTLHPRSKNDWRDRVAALPEPDRPDAFLKLLSDKGTRKGDLAQEIVRIIGRGFPVAVPDYIYKAVIEVIR